MPNHTDTVLATARRIFSSDRYATELTGIEIVAVSDHESRCALTINENHLNARGIAMGGVLFTLADFAAAIASNTDCLDTGILQWVSLDATIHYLSPASGDCLTAHCIAIKHGRATALYQTDVVCGNRKVAVVETTMVHV